MNIDEIKFKMLSEYEKQFNGLLNQFNSTIISSKEFIKHINYLNKRYNFTRIDIKNHGSPLNDVEFLEYAKDMNMYKPDWFRDDLGIGSKLEWEKNNSEFIFKCIKTGNLKIFIRGVDFRDINNLRIPIYINLTKFTVNNNVIFNGNSLIWHDAPYVFEKKCQDQQYFQIKLEFKTLFEYYPPLNFHISEDIQINSFSEKIKKYISMEKSILR